jgi:hypothetical protein
MDTEPEEQDLPTEDPLLQRALEMFNKDYKTVTIARELGVHPSTVRRWFKSLGMPPRKAGVIQPVRNEYVDEKDDMADDLEDNLEDYTDAAIRVAKHNARLDEDTAMLDIADSQSSPADKYQHYMAAAGIKLLRDSMAHLRGPKTVRELSELDQMIRRNLGLNAKSGGGTSKMHIDISILNNAKADRGNGTISRMKPTIIDIDEEYTEEE